MFYYKDHCFHEKCLSETEIENAENEMLYFLKLKDYFVLGAAIQF